LRMRKSMPFKCRTTAYSHLKPRSTTYFKRKATAHSKQIM